MNDLTTQFNNVQSQPTMDQQSVLAQSSASREMEEVKGAIFLAKQFPRNYFESEKRIQDACKRPSLATTATYAYKRGSSKVEGPSIRLAEVLAQNWGNLSYGIQELEQRDGESVAKAYCWDLETNVRQEKVFTVKHVRSARGSLTKLTEPRDIYERVASDGARRLRACILGVIPGDVVEMAVEQCRLTLAGQSDKPLKDRISGALSHFKENYGVTQEMIEDRFGYNASSFSEFDLAQLTSIRNSLKDKMSKVEDWFDKEIGKQQSSGLAADFNKEQGEVKSDENTVPAEQE
ncbi:hypothetical protein [Lysinibacillus fusiformis]|uniref:hypothetical protein n=1 Tax=Lysinibacillus fusiformis TaxID=28031 RepID=UPI001169DCFB|nr:MULTISPECIES: hypothetical protein [Lysinibacillus]MED4668046.1 hypothetical protein [Lysinibacillus fusiformis]GED64322.1 hypothetical protein LFU01_27740 [Lysinibacillus fusiformis]